MKPRGLNLPRGLSPSREPRTL